MKRFFDVQFSLSVSEKFRYIRKMHILTMLVNIACVYALILSGVLILINISELIIYTGINQINILSDFLFLDDLSLNWGIMDIAVSRKWMLIMILGMVCCFITMLYFPIQSIIIFFYRIYFVPYPLFG